MARKLSTVLALVMIAGLGGASSGGCVMDSFRNVKVEGLVVSTNPEFGEWSVAPVSCVDGKERGFEGIALGFGPGPLYELRLDGAQEGNNIVELHMADTQATVYRVFEPQCSTISGGITRSNVSINGRHMFRLVGTIEFDCPEHGLRGNAIFDGCLPQTL